MSAQMNCTHPHAVVTGASSGIGRSTVLALARNGWHVYAGVRTPEDGASLCSEAAGITPVQLDVTAAEQISAAAALVGDHVGARGLDALVDNAGVGVAWPMELVPMALLRQQYEVNVVGQVAVTQAFTALLRAARGRLVIIGSIGRRFTPPFGGPLASSKAAIGSVADAFRQELAPWGIRVVLVEPASINTDAIGKLERDAADAVAKFPPQGRALYRDSYSAMVGAALRREQRGSHPDVVAGTVFHALTAARPRARYLVGKDAHLLATMVRLVPTGVLDALRRKIFHLPAPGSLAAQAAPEGAFR